MLEDPPKAIRQEPSIWTKFINEFKRPAFQLGLEISGTGIRNDFATSVAKRKADIELAKKWIEAADPLVALYENGQMINRTDNT